MTKSRNELHMSRHFKNVLKTGNWELKINLHAIGNITAAVVITASFVWPLIIVAGEPMSTDSYRLDPNVSNSFGGRTNTGNYELLDSGGEAAAGLGNSPSYKMSSGYIEQLEQAIEINVLPAGLAGYWPLNTGTGIQAYDTTPNNNNGVLGNGPAWVEGKVGQGALEFDGQDDVVSVPNDSSLNMSDSVTIQAWIYPTADGQSSRSAIAGKINANQCCGYEYGLRLRDDNRVSFDTMRIGNGDEFGSSNTAVELNTWTHVLATYDGSEKKIFIDGQLDATYDASGNLDTSDGSFSMGAFDGTYTSTNRENRRFEGRVDQVQVYRNAYSEEQVLDQYNASRTGIPSALTLPKITPGVSQKADADAVVRTDAGGYELSIEQDGDLRTQSDDTIPSISGTISNPDPWEEGSTTGFGFTVTGAEQRSSKWGTDPDYEYAAVPDTATTFHSRDGLSGGLKEVTGLQFRLGISHSQPPGFYQNRIGLTATLKP